MLRRVVSELRLRLSLWVGMNRIRLHGLVVSLSITASLRRFEDWMSPGGGEAGGYSCVLRQREHTKTVTIKIIKPLVKQMKIMKPSFIVSSLP